MSGCGTRIVLRGQKPLALCDPLPLLRFAVSATGGAHLCSIQYYLRFWLGICRTSLAVSALRIMRYCLRMIWYCRIEDNPRLGRGDRKSWHLKWNFQNGWTCSARKFLPPE
ncbi:hypothetical protein [Gemmiger qucibialis]|uniref:hypothetical protein n=1 Tax=Gemmiger qucibialis TaxID=2997294 RepID=UPI0022DFE788|nr:hypothetical protein [Gemmiger qucibialis]